MNGSPLMSLSWSFTKSYSLFTTVEYQGYAQVCVPPVKHSCISQLSQAGSSHLHMETSIFPLYTSLYMYWLDFKNKILSSHSSTTYGQVISLGFGVIYVGQLHYTIISFQDRKHFLILNSDRWDWELKIQITIFKKLTDIWMFYW